MAELKRIDLFDVAEDFPQKGVTFYDVRGFLRRPALFKQTIEEIAEGVAQIDCDVIMAPDARAFLFAAPLCVQEGMRLAMCRKPGKLPIPVFSAPFRTEYSEDTLEIGEFDLKPEDRVLLFDDVLATGGTMNAMKELCRQSGVTPIAAACVLELTSLGGRAEVGLPVWSWTQV